MEKIYAYAKVLWVPSFKIIILQSKLEVIEQVKSQQGPAVSTDSSSRNVFVGIRVYWQNLTLLDISIAIFSLQHLSVYSGKQVAIHASITCLHYLAQTKMPVYRLSLFNDFYKYLFRPPSPPSPWTTERTKPPPEYY